MLNDNKKVIPKVIFKNKKIEDEISEWITQSTISTHNVDNLQKHAPYLRVNMDISVI